jgi:hypothetical protein
MNCGQCAPYRIPAERALRHVEALGQETRPVGTTARPGFPPSNKSLISAAFIKRPALVTMKVLSRQRALAMGGSLCWK